MLAALTEFPKSYGVGIDCVWGAAKLARENSIRVGLQDRAFFMVSDWANAVRGSFDLVLSNPPYIESDAIATLMTEVSQHEPRTALDGGEDGLAAYRRLIGSVESLLSPNGCMVLELGLGQGRAVLELVSKTGLKHLLTRSDLGGVPRAMVLAPSDGL